MYIYWYITRGIENKLFGERPVMEDAEGGRQSREEGRKEGRKGINSVGMNRTVRLLKPHVSSGLEEESSDPASEADKRSDPPAEGESVEAGGNGCED